MKSMFKVTLAGGAAALALPSAAIAQDEERYFDGFYISGAVGLESVEDGGNALTFDTDGDGTSDDTVTTVDGDDAFAPGFCSGSPTAVDDRVCRGNGQNEGYALRAGFDRRFGDGPFVAGVLVEGAKPGVEEFTSGFSTSPATYTIGREIDWAVTARARLGLSPGEGRGLFYVTGGAGYAKIEHSFDTSNTANAFTPENGDDWQFGWQAGGGAEIMLTRNIGLGLEYLYSRYNDDEYVVGVTQGSAPDTNPFIQASDRTDIRLDDDKFDYHAFRATLNLRF